MGRYVPTQPSELKTIGDGDTAFLGVNDRLDPAQLPPGIASGAKNKRFADGIAATRKGIRKLNWLNAAADLAFPRRIDHFRVIYGRGEFKDPNGFHWELIAGEDRSGVKGVWRTQENSRLSPIPLPAAAELPSEVTFTQAFNVVLLFRGEALAELVMENLEEGFKPIVQQENLTREDPNDPTQRIPLAENPSDGTQPIPNAKRGIFLQNRVFIPHSRDLIDATDYLNYTRSSPTRAQFRINQGSADELTVIYKFNETAIIAFKEQSVYAILNVTGDLSKMVLDEITHEYGCRAPRSVAAAGTDVWFLADKRGICSIRQTEQNKLQGVDVPVSHDISKLIARINWRYADRAAARYINNRFYLAVPLDAAEVVKGNLLTNGVSYDAAGSYAVQVIPGRTYRWTKGADDVGVAEIRGLGATFDGAGNRSLPVTITGRTYRWTPGNAATLINGAQTLLAAAGPQTFVAQADSVTFTGTPGGLLSTTLGEVFAIYSGDVTVGAFGQVELFGTPSAPVTATLQPVFKGVNNAVLVYDFLNQKWAGYDQSAVLQVIDWATPPMAGQQRLVCYCADGFLNLYEEGFVDEDIMAESPLATEVQILSPPAAGLTFQAGTGTVVTTAASNTNTGSTWGIGAGAGNLAQARSNFWGAAGGAGGYRMDAGTPWTAPDHETTQLTASVVRVRKLKSSETGAQDGAADITTNIPAANVLIEPVAMVYYRQIEDELLTRGYTCQNVERKDFLRLQAHTSTWNPRYSIDAVRDGANEVNAVVSDRTKNRTKYYKPHDKADYDTTNVNDDFFTPHREDYALIQAETEGVFLDGAGVNPDLHQEVGEKFWLHGSGRYLQVRFRNTQGRQEVRSCVVEARPASKRFGVHS